jgi:threonine dehydratase
MSVSLAQVQAAARRIAPHIRRTPLVRADGLSEGTGRDTWLKLESLQRTRSFKRRGACNVLLALGERASVLPPLVTASAGNHALALSSVARELSARLTIFVPRDAPHAKLDRLRGEGITIVADCADYDEAESRALAAAAVSGSAFISAYNHPDVIAGAGTIALEILEDLPDTAAIVVPTGGGGLLAGVAAGADGRVAVVGVEPSANPAFSKALAAGHTTTIVPGTSLADGLLGNLEPNALTFDLVRQRGIPVHIVPEPFVVQGVQALFAHERLIAEGAGGIAVGALLAGTLADLPDPLVLLVTGANIDASMLVRVLGS